MNRHVLEISTPVFRVLRRRAPFLVSWSDEKLGPTQYIVVDDDIYNEMIDRAIFKRKTIDEVFLEVGTRGLSCSSTVALHQAVASSGG